jgi:hypothetical protein
LDYRDPVTGRVVPNSNLERLQNVAIGFIIANTGLHTGLYSLGRVIDFHWDQASTEPERVSVSEFSTWKPGQWRNGVIIMPPEEAARFWGELPPERS